MTMTVVLLLMVGLLAYHPSYHTTTQTHAFIHHRRRQMILSTAAPFQQLRTVSILQSTTTGGSILHSSSSGVGCYSSFGDSTTLNDDGDFLISGINDNDKSSSSSSSSSSIDFLSLSSSSSVTNTQAQQQVTLSPRDILFPSSSNDVRHDDDKELMQQQQRRQHDNDDGDFTMTSSHDEDGDVSEVVVALEGFIASLFSSTSLLSSHPPNEKYATSLLLKTYARELANIGFDPDCDEISRELEYEDLTFMKLLHRRYFWKEWMKLISDE